MYLNQNNPHGGDTYGKNGALDLSSNVNPYGIPEEVKNAARRAVDGCERYPDPYCRELRERISQYENVPADQILCGNGAAELIYSFAYSLPKDRPALIVSPSFSEYEKALAAAGIEAEIFLLREEDGFVLGEDILREDLESYGAVFLASPNNPTGRTVDPDLLWELARTGVRIFADMCFLELSDEPGKYGIPILAAAHENVVFLKAFTKTFAVPGLRLGYAVSSDVSFLTEMSEKAPCWNVSVPAQEAGIAALSCGEWLRETAGRIRAERERVRKELLSMGLRVYPGEANYLLIYSDRELCAPLFERGIIVRDCSNFIGLGKGFIRIAIRTEEENDRLTAALKEVLM